MCVHFSLLNFDIRQITMRCVIFKHKNMKKNRNDMIDETSFTFRLFVEKFHNVKFFSFCQIHTSMNQCFKHLDFKKRQNSKCISLHLIALKKKKTNESSLFYFEYFSVICVCDQ